MSGRKCGGQHHVATAHPKEREFVLNMDASAHLSGAPHPLQAVVYDEAGHAVMARLLGRVVYSIRLQRMSSGPYAGAYNGRTDWGRDSPAREWDARAPYDSLVRSREEYIQAVVLIFAAGKAAERTWYRKTGADEALASFGEKDERELERELLAMYRSQLTLELTSAQLDETKLAIEDLAMRLLSEPRRWRAVEAIATTLLQELQHAPEEVRLEGEQVHAIISQAWRMESLPSTQD
jgi:hypothetical protein